MTINKLLLAEFNEEMRKTRTTLERVPVDKKDFSPHPKSMPLGKLAPHVAQLAGFGVSVLTTPELDFSKGSYKPIPLESTEQLLKVFDEGVTLCRTLLTTRGSRTGSSVSRASPSSTDRAFWPTGRCSSTT